MNRRYFWRLFFYSAFSWNMVDFVGFELCSNKRFVLISTISFLRDFAIHSKAIRNFWNFFVRPKISLVDVNRKKSPRKTNYWSYLQFKSHWNFRTLINKIKWIMINGIRFGRVKRSVYTLGHFAGDFKMTFLTDSFSIRFWSILNNIKGILNCF